MRPNRQAATFTISRGAFRAWRRARSGRRQQPSIEGLPRDRVRYSGRQGALWRHDLRRVQDVAEHVLKVPEHQRQNELREILSMHLLIWAIADMVNRAARGPCRPALEGQDISQPLVMDEKKNYHRTRYRPHEAGTPHGPQQAEGRRWR